MSEGRSTDISAMAKPGVLARAAQAARYVISGVSPSTWFGPLQPLTPLAPTSVEGRRFDYPVGYNLSYTPRGSDNTAISFDDLRALADNCDILRTVIETRKDQMEALDWNIRIKANDRDKRASATDEQQGRIDQITEFFQYPNKTDSWEQWLRQWLEQMFVIDAACLYKRRDRKGDLFSLEIMDGATIKILLDDSGRRPFPPDPAYQQILKGIPAVDYTSDELLYLMHNPRAHKVYGYSHVEQVLLTVNTLIRRTLHQLEYYRDGSQPDAFMGLPKEWTQEQVVAFQRHFDSIMAGNLAQRRRVRFMPGDFKYQEVKPPQLKDEYDEWLARVICYVFSVAPTPFIKQMNRATAQSSHDQALEEGLAPLQKYIRNNLNRIIKTEFKSPDLEFYFVDDREQDPKEAAVIRESDVRTGIISVDEARENIGLDPLGGAYAVAMPLIATGFLAPKMPEQQEDTDANIGHNGGPPLDDEHEQQGNDGTHKHHHIEQSLALVKGVKKKSARSNHYLSTGHSHARR
jgi:PAS domain-containing protein